MLSGCCFIIHHVSQEDVIFMAAYVANIMANNTPQYHHKHSHPCILRTEFLWMPLLQAWQLNLLEVLLMIQQAKKAYIHKNQY